MRLDSKFLGLPASILLLVASYSETAYADNDKAAARWTFNLLSKLQWPGASANRDMAIENGGERKPVGVLKMSDDEGEKFYMEYWQFGGNTPSPQAPVLSMGSSQSLRKRNEKEEALLLANSSVPISYRPAFALHTNDFHTDLKARGQEAARALAVLQNRQFSCPTGTLSCEGIGYPNSCCATDETCFPITDTGLGPVGCCPKDSSCGGTITACDAPNTACPDNNGGSYTGGGCCIPDYVCAGVGCVLNTTAMTTSVVTSTYTGQASTSLTVITVVTPVTATTVITQSTTDSTTESTSTYTGLQTTLACSTSSHACPVGMGGGCCGDGYACASSSSCIALSSSSTTSTTSVVTTTQSSSTATGVVPVRPTGDTTTSTSSSGLATTCPIGFYACEAYYAGGCCRTGRNCDTTSCPATSSTTIISSGVTIVVPVGAAATTANPTGSCASGWLSCAASVGGNCCPKGYECGTASCSLVEATTTVVSPKEASSGKRLDVRRINVIALLGQVVGMLVLI